METKEVKINIPEGYEIDKENSTFECIKFKPVKDITYEDCCKKLFPNCKGFYINAWGEIANIANNFSLEPSTSINTAPTRYQLEKLLALNKLLNIARYYNNHKYVEKGYMIAYNKEDCCYEVISVGNSYYKLTAIDPIFEKTEDAKAVIDNPNFRSILDTLCK